MIRVLVVDETPVLGRVTAAAIESDPNIHVTGCAATAEEALAKILRYNVALTSVTLPGSGALDLIRAVTHSAPWIKVLAVGTPESRDRLIRCVEAGAAGYIYREGSVAQLVRAIELARRGQAIVTPEAILAERAHLLDRTWMGWETEVDMRYATDLTSFERRVLQLVRRGLRHQEIADYLNIERSQARHHVHSILRKLNNNLVLQGMVVHPSTAGRPQLSA